MNTDDLAFEIQDGLLSYKDLCLLQDAGIITNSLREHVNAASIDLTLGETLLIEVETTKRISLRSREALTTRPISIAEKGYSLMPGEFVLAHTEQKFFLPAWLSAEYKLKSSLGRIGLEHMNSGWCDAGWHNSVLTLEFKNLSSFHRIELNKGDRIGQIIFFKHAEVPDHAKYHGRYNNDGSVSGVKV